MTVRAWRFIATRRGAQASADVKVDITLASLTISTSSSDSRAKARHRATSSRLSQVSSLSPVAISNTV